VEAFNTGGDKETDREEIIMSKENAGGPAMPGFQHTEGYGQCKKSEQGWEYYESGMTLRDYFAAKAMNAMIQSQIWVNLNRTDPSQIAGDAYQYADAMLAERNK
jgi:hypothetical protein